MKRKPIIILCSIPVLFGLFMLALINPILMLAGVIAILLVLLILKQFHPEWFVRKPKESNDPYKTTTVHEISVKDPEPKNKTYVILSSIDGSETKRIAVDRPIYSIGRDGGNDFVLSGDKVSRRHLLIQYDENEDRCFAVDQGAANHTYRNGECMEPNQRYPLYEGDRITIGGRNFTVSYAHY